MLRWAGMAAAGGLLALVLSARAPQPTPQTVSLGVPDAASPLIGQMLTGSGLAASGMAGPYVTTVAAASFDGDVRYLPRTAASPQPLRPELEPPNAERARLAGVDDMAAQLATLPAGPSVAMPAPMQNFDGLNFSTAGAGLYPPDTNGDVGPDHYVQTVNTSVGIFSKTGTPLAAFAFNSLWAGAKTHTACDNANQGDPVALYDAQANRFIVSDFAFTSTASGPFYECLAASKTADPISGGWWLYALPTHINADAHQYIADYPKLGVWPDGIYLSANMFDCHSGCGGSAVYVGPRAWALNRSDLFSGGTLRSVAFPVSPSFFSLLPSNYRGAAPPAGTPNYFVSTDFSNAFLDVFKFHADFVTPGNSTFMGPKPVAIASFADPPNTVGEPGGANNLDTLQSRLMMQNQYRNLGGAESLWVTHTAGKAPPNITGLRWYQLDVSHGVIETTPTQQSTYRPDTSNRWMPSLAVDHNGDMAIGYSVVNTTSLFPTIRYAGRLVTDPLNSLVQTETTLVTGTGGQNTTCGSTCIRWGDYSAMTVDPVDDCTFWYTTEYYATSGGNWQTRIGSFRLPPCTSAPPVWLYLPLVRR